MKKTDPLIGWHQLAKSSAAAQQAKKTKRLITSIDGVLQKYTRKSRKVMKSALGRRVFTRGAT